MHSHSVASIQALSYVQDLGVVARARTVERSFTSMPSLKDI